MRQEPEELAAAVPPGPWPRRIQLELTSRCPLRCPLCHSQVTPYEGPAFFPWEGVEAILGGLAGQPSLFVLYGKIGEPLTYPHLVEVVEAAHRRGPTMTRISTNAMLLGGALRDALAGSPLTQLIVALDGATPATYAAYRRGGDFHRVCRNIEAFARARDARGGEGPRLIAQFLPMRHNEHEIEDFVALAESLGCDEARIKLAGSVARSPRYRPLQALHRLGPSGRISRDGGAPTEGGPGAGDGAAPLRSAPGERLGSLGTLKKGQREGQPWCDLSEVYVDTRGEVFPCCHAAAYTAGRKGEALSLGNVLEDGWDAIVQGEALERFRARFRRADPPRVCRRKCTGGLNKSLRKIRFR